MLCGLWTAENPTGLKPTGVFCDFWLRFSSPDGASWNIFHERQHFCNLGGDYQQMMLRTWMTGEVPVPGSVLGHSSSTSYANKNFAVLVKPEWPPPASTPTPHSPSWDSFHSVHSVHYLPAESAKSENNQAGWKHYANSETVSDQRDETRPPGGTSHPAQVFMQYFLGEGKIPVRCKRLACKLWILPPAEHQRKPQPSSLLLHDAVG